MARALTREVACSPGGDVSLRFSGERLSRLRIGSLLSATMVAFGCAETVSMRPQRVAEILEQSTAAAQAHVRASQDFEAAQLLIGVEHIDPDFAPAQSVRASVPDDLLRREHPT